MNTKKLVEKQTWWTWVKVYFTYVPEICLAYNFFPVHFFQTFSTDLKFEFERIFGPLLLVDSRALQKDEGP
jgi:hypothetical protein